MPDTRYQMSDSPVRGGVGSGIRNLESGIPMISWRRRIYIGVILTLAVMPVELSAQELVPAAYTPAPYGINFLSVSAVYNSGDLAFDPAGPIEDASAKIFASTLGYARTLNVAGRSANVGVIVPYVLGDLEGIYLGEQAYAERSGLGDLAFRCAVNLFGAPAMSPKEFSTYRARTLIGASLVVKAPTGQYDSSKLINIGTNRWAFKPEIGVVRVMGRWAIDAYVGGWFFTDDADFFGGMKREQDPGRPSTATSGTAGRPRWTAQSTTTSSATPGSGRLCPSASAAAAPCVLRPAAVRSPASVAISARSGCRMAIAGSANRRFEFGILNSEF